MTQYTIVITTDDDEELFELLDSCPDVVVDYEVIYVKEE